MVDFETLSEIILFCMVYILKLFELVRNSLELEDLT